MPEQTFTPTSHPEFFLDETGFLHHAEVGRLGIRGSGGLRLADGSELRLYEDAPALTIDDVRRASPKGYTGGERIAPTFDKVGRFTGIEVAAIFAAATKYVGDLSGWLQLADFVPQVIDLVTGYDDATSDTLARINHRINDVLVRVGQQDYLDLMRRMSEMLGNALGITHKLEGIRDRLTTIDANSFYELELKEHDAELIGDINALLHPHEAFFRRVYVEELAHGDGLWQSTMPDRANEAGTTFEYRIALPTVMSLISVRLAVMKFRDRRFSQLTGVHEEGPFQHEIKFWWERLHQLHGKMASYIRPTPLVKVEIQSMRRRTFGGQEVGRFSNWQNHCSIAPPNSVNPVGAVDITTGTSWIDWEHVQFDEWYLAKGNLHGQGGGYWPPSVGQQLYRPPPNAVGLPPLDRSIEEFYSLCHQDALTFKNEAIRWTGGHVTSFANQVLRIGFPHSPI